MFNIELMRGEVVRAASDPDRGLFNDNPARKDNDLSPNSLHQNRMGKQAAWQISL